MFNISRYLAGAAMIVSLTLVSCGQVTPFASPSSAESFAVPISQELRDLLASNGTALEPSEDDGDGMTPEEILDLFLAMYAQESLAGEPVVWAARIDASDETALSPGRQVRIVHVADQPIDAPLPMSPPGDEGDSEPPDVEAQMLAFFDATDGEHLVTKYIAPRVGG